MSNAKTLINQTSIFEVNTPEVVAEVIDSELVAIHLGSGCYYHGNVSGAQIWELLTHHYTLGEISSELAVTYNLTKDQALADALSFVKKLHQEKLIRKSGNLAQVPTSLTKIGDYLLPTLKKHEDMKELLLLDPIHDVGEKTWDLTKV